MKKEIHDLLNKELKSIEDKNIKTKHFILKKFIRGNRMDFIFVDIEDNFRYAHVSVSFDPYDNLHIQKSFKQGTKEQKIFFILFLKTILEIVKEDHIEVLEVIKRRLNLIL